MNRNYIFHLFFVLIQHLLLINGLSADEQSQKTGSVTALSLNIRSGPSTRHGIITQLNKNDSVRIIEAVDGWLRIDISPSVETWIPKSCLSFDNKIVYETRVYSGPGELFKSYTDMQPGQVVSVLNVKNDTWVQIKPAVGIIGWASAKYIKSDIENLPPTIGEIKNITLDEDHKSKRIPLIVDEGENPMENQQVLTVTAMSSDTTIIPAENIRINFSDDESDAPDGWFEIFPEKDKNGSCKIIITVSDGFMDVSTAFFVSILPVNDIPVISEISDQTTVEERNISEIIFTASEGGGRDEYIQVLTVKAISSNSRLIPDDNIIIDYFDDHTGSIGGTLNLVPIKDQVGNSTITIRVSDGESSAETSFLFSVTPVNDPPIVSGIPEIVTIYKDDRESIITFTADKGGGEDEESQKSVIAAGSNNQSIISNDNIRVDFSDDNTDASDGTIVLIPNETVSESTMVTLTASDNIKDHETSISVEISDAEKPSGLDHMIDGRESIVIPTVPPSLVLAQPVRGIKRDSLKISSQFTTLETEEDVGLKGIPFRIDLKTNSNISKSDFSFSISSTNTKLISDSNVILELTDFDETGSSGLIDILPNKNEIGNAQINILSNYNSKKAELILNLTVTPVNDLPTMSKIPDLVIDEDGIIKGIKFTVDEGGGRDEDIQVLEINAVSSNKSLIPNENIVISYSNIKSDKGSGNIDIIPKNNEFGLAIITIQLFDGTDYNESSFSVFVNSVNDRPLAFDQKVSVSRGFSNINILTGVDVEDARLSFKLVEQAKKGIVKILNKEFGNFRYTPNENASGTDHFDFVVNDGKIDSEPARVSIVIE